MDTVETRNQQTLIDKTNGNIIEATYFLAALDFVTSLMPPSRPFSRTQFNITKIRYT